MRIKYLKNISLMFILLIFSFCSDGGINEPEKPNPLLGTWKGEYEYQTGFWEQVVPNNGEVTDTGYKAETILTFSESSVEIRTLPARIEPFLVDDKLVRGLFADTLYEGSYQIENDTLELMVKGTNYEDFVYKQIDKEKVHKFIFSVRGDILNLEMYLPPREDGYAPAFYSSFMFGYSWNTKECKLMKQ